METNRANFHPIISSIQKIALYETKSKFYLVGSNNTQTRFRVLKIDRFAPKDLLINDDKTEYTPDEIHSLVNMIDSGNQQQSQSQQQQQQQRGISKIISAFGIVGFIRFLEGYYIILITKRRKIAIIGYHTIYKIEDTSMIYIPHDSVRIVHPDEQRYVKMFQNIDLASNFYFSYSYDITHTLQYNLVNPKLFIPRRDDSNIDDNDDNTSTTTDLSDMIKNSSDYGIRTSPNQKFVWNLYLLKKLEENDIHPDWLLYIIHGFIGQSKINIFGRSILITLIARRSSKYAGTRFLKRGANADGDVANEVETEQIVNDATKSSLNLNNFTSFVQLRGSIPGNWRQDMGKMVGKPTIIIDLLDPYCEISSKHFNDILKRYGTPIIILNLVKQKERNNKKQESLLSNEFYKTIKYLNQFLSPPNQIIYKQFDMASKLKLNINIMENLNLLTKNCIKKIGIFHNIINKQQQQLFKQQLYDNRYNLQCGIIRTNCVDCLDRTNTAQFAIGKCVLGYQLYILGVLDKLDIDFDTDCIRMLESLYEDHGDTLALQYGGSQLVHRIKTYRKTSPWTSQGNDIMQTLSRYYSNTFSDAEKQNAINLFLGVFVPNENESQIWEYTSDYYFHHKLNNHSNNNNKSLTQWWDSEVIKYLPYSLNDIKKSCYEIIQIHNRYDTEMIDGFIDYYRPYELTILNDLYFFNITNSIRDFMPNFTTDYSPFILRIRPIRRREENYNYKKNQQSYNCNKNPSVTGQSSTSSATSSASSCDEPADDETVDELTNQQLQQNNEDGQKPITFKSLFPTMLQVYGTELKSPNRNDIFLYKNYVLIGKKANGTTKQLITPTISSSSSLKAKSQFLNDDSTVSVQPPKVDQNSIEIYKKYVKSGRNGYVDMKSNDLVLYGSYANFDLKNIQI